MKVDFADYNTIDIVEFLKHHGYHSSTRWAKSKNCRNYPALENVEFNDRVIINRNANLYVRDTDSRYRDIVDFVYNRLETNFKSDATESSSLSSALKILNNYRGSPAVERKEFLQESQRHFNVADFKITALAEHPYLKGLAISQSTLHSLLFLDKIHLVSNPNLDKDAKYPYFPPNVGFPYVKSLNNVAVGYELRSNNFKGHALNSNKKEGVWISNVPPNCDYFFIVESAKDALAHFELNKKNNVVYCSVGGNLTKEQLGTINLITTEISKNQNRPIRKVLGFDNDLAGSLFSLQYLLYQLSPMNSVREIKMEVNLSMIADQTALHIVKKMELKEVLTEGKEVLTLVLPKSKDIIDKLVKIVLSFNKKKFINDLVIAKPRTKDHYDDLIEKKNFKSQQIKNIIQI